MTDITKYKSVAIDLKTYGKLKQICKDEHRNIRQQIGKLVNEDYTKKYGSDISSSGVNSVA